MSACGITCTCDWNRIDNERVTEVLRLLDKSAQYVDQTPGRGGITGLQHALRTAGLASEFGWHKDSAFVGLVHDLARPLNDVHHGEIIAEIVRDRVRWEAYEVLRTHGAFQSSIVHKTAWPYQERPWFAWAQQLAAFEVRTFQHDYTGPEMTLGAARALIREYLGDAEREAS